MTKIHMTSKWSEVKPEGFYVYLHRRATDGGVFYVGKGKGKRAWVTASRTDYWNRVARKHRVIVEICQDGMEEEGSFLLEEWLIAKFRHDGVQLVNMSTGGEGASGCGRNVHSSCGMSFTTIVNAVEWLHKNGYPKATQSKVSDACRGASISAYGRAWAYENDDVADYSGRSATMKSISTTSKVVYCSNGMKFASIRDAANWVRYNYNKSARHTPISYCLSGRYKSAYGFSWSLDFDEVNEYVDPNVTRSISTGTPIYCGNGMLFHSGGAAAKWLRSIGFEKASDANIMKCCKGQIKTAYGYKWEYA